MSAKPVWAQPSLSRPTQFLGRIVEQPAHFPIVYREFRRALMRRFPYAVYFIAQDEAVIVFAVLHQRRDRTLLSERR
jgi:plasmid stabilization system protein ParE